jgi:hypothetical protein
VVTREISEKIPSGTRPWNPTLDKERQGWGTRQHNAAFSDTPYVRARFLGAQTCFAEIRRFANGRRAVLNGL